MNNRSRAIKVYRTRKALEALKAQEQSSGVFGQYMGNAARLFAEGIQELRKAAKTTVAVGDNATNYRADQAILALLRDIGRLDAKVHVIFKHATRGK